MNRWLAVRIIVWAVPIGMIVTGCERELPRHPPSRAIQVAAAASAEPIAKVDLAGTPRATPCPTMGALEAPPIPAEKQTASENRCAKISTRPRAR